LTGVSKENVAKSLDFIADYNRRDFDAALEFFHPDVEWILPDLQQSDSGHGKEEIRRFFDGIDETFDELWLEARESVDGGDRVAVRLRHHGRGRGSGLEIDEELYHQVATFRDGLIVRMEYFTTWDEALRATRP
jgi:ketosteroid isomerase-like protein